MYGIKYRFQKKSFGEDKKKEICKEILKENYLKT